MNKVVKKLRGTLREYEDESLDFVPVQEGPPRQKGLKKIGNSSKYETNGEKSKSLVYHISVPATQTDPEAAAAEMFYKLQESDKRDPALVLRGRIIHNEAGLKIKINSKSQKIQIYEEIDLNQDSSWKDELMSKTTKLYKICITNQALIQKAIRALEKNS